MPLLFGLIPIPDSFPLFKKLTYSKAFEKIAKKCFVECDVDSDNRLTVQELYICLLLLYDRMNSKLPCHIKVPKKDQVIDLFKRHDKDGSGTMCYPEFLDVARVLFADDKSFKDSIFLRVVTTLVLKMLVWPTGAVLVKASLCGMGLEAANKVPDSVISHGLETVGKYASGYVAA